MLHKNFYYLIILTFFASACATYYNRSIEFQNLISEGNFSSAAKWLESDRLTNKPLNKVINLLNRAYVSRMTGNYTQSIDDFLEAEKFIEDYNKNFGKEMLSMVTNPMTKPYKVEDFESVMVNYYQAMNYIDLNRYDEAIIECKRINNKLNELNDKYKDHKNKYQRDAFANNLMGMLYEANKDFNNAFIAYRNAYNVYKEDYEKYFGISAPEQLKKDLIRTADLTGFYDEVAYYEKEFGIKYQRKEKPESELIFFWENGMGPVKSEWSINFASTYNNGVLILENKEMNLLFNFPIIGNQEGFNSFSFLRVAFPKYEERQPFFNSASVAVNNDIYQFQLVQNFNSIAFKTLDDRMLRELSNSLLRLATKKAIEIAAKQQSQGIGLAVGIANAITEKADTRNWQTIPYSLSYVRIPISEGVNTLNFSAKGENGRTFTKNFEIIGKKGKIVFNTFHNLASFPPSSINR